MTRSILTLAIAASLAIAAPQVLAQAKKPVAASQSMVGTPSKLVLDNSTRVLAALEEQPAPPPPLLSGTEIMALLGLPPGPRVGEAARALAEAAALGVRNLLLLKGDDPKQGDQPDAKPVFDYDTAALTAVAVAIRDKGELPTGRKVAGKAEFFIAAADVPIDPPAGWEPKSLKAKLAAGCEFVQTQFCMDATVVRRYMARLAEHGVNVPFLIGISPLRSAKSARWMREKLFGTIIPDATVARLEAASDPAAEGRKLCLDLMKELATIPGVAGVHIMAPGNEGAIADVIKDAVGLKRAR